MQLDGLTGKRVLVTAGASGIGRATARAFVDAGARVHVCDVDDSALDAFGSENPSTSASMADVADEAAVDRLFADVTETLGGLDVLVNNAGIAGPTAGVEDIDYADWQRCVNVNLGGAFLCARRAVPLLKAAGGGAIVNLSSTAGLFGYPRRAPYASAKWAIIGFTKTLAMELGPHGIRVNAICPGAVSGPRMDRVIAAEAGATGVSEDAVRKAYTDCVSLRTFIDPEDIAAMIVFLCSDAAAKVSGQAVPVDGHSESIS